MMAVQPEHRDVLGPTFAILVFGPRIMPGGMKTSAELFEGGDCGSVDAFLGRPMGAAESDGDGETDDEHDHRTLGHGRSPRRRVEPLRPYEPSEGLGPRK